MKRKILCILGALLLVLMPVCTVHASERTAGYVLFAQRYGEIASPSQTGIRVGTVGGVPSLFMDSGLYISVSDDRKTYLLLPDLPAGAAWADTYTVEISFRFTEIEKENGYFGVLMTGQGDAPLNRTEVLFRGNGTSDGFGSFSEAFTAAMAAGETVSASILVKHGMMYEVRALCDGIEERFPLAEVRPIDEGSRGFVLRNAAAAVLSVEVVVGVEYEEKHGAYADGSYTVEGNGPDIAPDTGEALVALPIALAAVVLTRYTARRRRV